MEKNDTMGDVNIEKKRLESENADIKPSKTVGNGDSDRSADE